MDRSHITITWAGTPLYEDGSKLTRARSRHQRKLADPLRRITLGDLNYFARFPHRRYRVREADIAEIEHAELTGGGVTPRPGNRHYRAVRYLTPYTCLSKPVGGPADIDPESLDEEMARAIFKHKAPDEPSIYLQGNHTYGQILAIIGALK
jgi:hypothetical protein